MGFGIKALLQHWGGGWGGGKGRVVQTMVSFGISLNLEGRIIRGTTKRSIIWTTYHLSFEYTTFEVLFFYDA